MEIKDRVETSDFKTEIQILDAMDRLMSNTPLMKLTVTAICQEAGVSRQTFYHHFTDKFQVVQWYWGYLGERYLKPVGRTLTWYQGNVGMFTELSSRPSFWRHALKENEHYASCGAHARRTRREFLIETITVYRRLQLSDELLFEIDFLLEAESRLIAYWLMSGMEIPPEQLADRIDRCIPRTLYTLLNTPTLSTADRTDTAPLSSSAVLAEREYAVFSRQRCVPEIESEGSIGKGTHKQALQRGAKGRLLAAARKMAGVRRLLSTDKSSDCDRSS